MPCILSEDGEHKDQRRSANQGAPLRIGKRVESILRHFARKALVPLGGFPGKDSGGLWDAVRVSPDRIRKPLPHVATAHLPYMRNPELPSQNSVTVLLEPDPIKAVPTVFLDLP